MDDGALLIPLCTMHVPNHPYQISRRVVYQEPKAMAVSRRSHQQTVDQTLGASDQVVLVGFLHRKTQDRHHGSLEGLASWNIGHLPGDLG